MEDERLVNFSFGDDEEKEKENIISLQEVGVEVKQYDCHKCNTSFCSLNMNDITKCIICGDTEIEKNEFFLSENLSYIPFLKNKDEVIKLYKKKVFFNPLIPISFKKKSVLDSIQKLYIPSLLTNMSQSGIVEFLGGEKKEFRDDNGKKRELKKFLVVQNIEFNYRNALFNPSSKVPEKVFQNICTYTFDSIQEFDSNYKDEFLYLIEDVSVSDMREKAKNYISNSTLSVLFKNILHPMKKLKKDSSIIQFEDTKKVLVPIYFLNMKYHKKNYFFIMNGENGRFLFNFPIGILETILFSVVSFIVIFLIAYVISILL